jgi:hypothetical protein
MDAVEKDGGAQVLERFVQPCETETPAKRWVVGIDWGETETVKKSLYFKMSRTNGAFRIFSVSEIRPSGCPGESQPDYEPDLTLR